MNKRQRKKSAKKIAKKLSKISGEIQEICPWFANITNDDEFDQAFFLAADLIENEQGEAALNMLLRTMQNYHDDKADSLRKKQKMIDMVKDEARNGKSLLDVLHYEPAAEVEFEPQRH